VRVTDAAYRDGIYVAVGDVRAFEPTGRAWRSTDGINWVRAQDVGFAGNVVVATEDGFIAIGPLGDETRVWRSSDGNAWTLLPASVDLGFINDVAYSNGVLVAVGTTRDLDAYAVWMSGDGVTWTIHNPPDGCCELSKVAVRGGDIVVIGDDFMGYGRGMWIRQDHSVGWRPVDVFDDDVDGRLLDLATDGESLVAVGYQDSAASGEHRPMAVVSVDGFAWTVTRIPGIDWLVFDQVVALPDRSYLSIASTRNHDEGQCQPDACVEVEEVAGGWLSNDGVTWRPGAEVYSRREQVPAEVGDEVGHRRAVVVGASGAVVFDPWYGAQHVFYAPLGSFAQ
jgi:hypothetical protein